MNLRVSVSSSVLAAGALLCSCSSVPLPPECEALRCESRNLSCGEAPDGCGGVVQCGQCGAPSTCGGGGVANLCGQPPADGCTAESDLRWSADVASVMVSTDHLVDHAAGACGGSGAPDGVFRFEIAERRRLLVVAAREPVTPAFRPVVYVRKVCESASASNELGCAVSSVDGALSLDIPGLPPGAYFLWVDGHGGTRGEMTLTATLLPPLDAPSNDTCAAVQELSIPSSGARIGVSTVAAAADTSGLCGGEGRDVVYAFSLAQRGSMSATVEVSPETPSWRPALMLRKTCDGTTAGEEIHCAAAAANGVSVSVEDSDLPPGRYFLWVDGALGSGGSGELVVKVGTPTAPANDGCASPQQLSFLGNAASASFDLKQAKDDAFGSCGGSSATASARDVVYALTLTQVRAVRVVVETDATTPGYMPVVYLRSTCVYSDEATERGCNEGKELFVPRVEPGDYFLWVDSFNRYEGKGRVTVTLEAPMAPPPNDLCSAPTDVVFSGNFATFTADTRGAGSDVTGSCGGGGPDVVYRFEASGNRPRVQILYQTATPGYRPVVYVRSACASGELACDSSRGVVEAQLVAREYYLFVDGLSGTSGELQITIYR